ncbi:hypothetical protein Sxan_65520 [Streptomyces xanthophaeus]|uniref:Uncharacterized protein n=1 Tax=Streptomyces xanthophaeus TaxID=67385 RepID=A0A919H222_9ACTN|nr:hypothetical protein Sxan_65520 [Streptomyces xanthophaeus]
MAHGGADPAEGLDGGGETAKGRGGGGHRTAVHGDDEHGCPFVSGGGVGRGAAPAIPGAPGGRPPSTLGRRARAVRAPKGPGPGATRPGRKRAPGPRPGALFRSSGAGSGPTVESGGMRGPACADPGHTE